MSTISIEQLDAVKELYYVKGYSMLEVARQLGVTISAVIHFMDKNQLQRRTFAEMQKLRFINKMPSFTTRIESKVNDELRAIGAMLYWGEGYKGNDSKPAGRVDFANSDPEMIAMFLAFLRSMYILDESKFRILLYCYKNQDTQALVQYWSNLTSIPREKFTKPYTKKGYRAGANQMKYGLIHIRYSDKKLLLEIKKLIDYYKAKYCAGGGVVNRT